MFFYKTYFNYWEEWNFFTSALPKRVNWLKFLCVNKYIYIYLYIQMKVSRGTRIVLDNEGAVTIEYVVKLLSFWVHMDFNTNLFRRPTWLAHSSVILHTNCRQKFESYTETTWYVTRTVRKPLETTKLVPALPGRFTLTWVSVQKIVPSLQTFFFQGIFPGHVSKISDINNSF